MTFTRRYLDSLLSAGLRPVAESAPRTVPRLSWWQRYVASLLDMPLAHAPTSHTAAQASPAPRTETPSPTGGTPNKLLRIKPDASTSPTRVHRPNAVMEPVTASARALSWGKGMVALMAVVTVLAGLSVAWQNSLHTAGSSQSPPPYTFPASGGSTGLPSPGTTSPGTVATQEPSGSPSTGPAGRVLWRGTLSFITQASSNTMPVVGTPATPLLADGDALALCASSCESPAISGQLVPWAGNEPPEYGQCHAKLADVPSYGYIPVRAGQKACFVAGPGAIGYFTVLTASPAVTATGVIWSW